MNNPQTHTVRQVLDLFSHLKTLNGRDVVVKTPGQPDRVVIETYQFDAKTTWTIAKNLNVLKRHVEVFEETRTRIAQSLGGPEGIKADNVELMKKFTEQMSDVLDEEVTLVGVSPIPLAGLNLDRNAIQPGVLAALASIIAE